MPVGRAWALSSVVIPLVSNAKRDAKDLGVEVEEVEVTEEVDDELELVEVEEAISALRGEVFNTCPFASAGAKQITRSP